MDSKSPRRLSTSTPSGQLRTTLEQIAASFTTSMSKGRAQQALRSAEANFVLFSFSFLLYFLIRLNLFNNLVKVYMCIYKYIFVYIYV